MSLNYEDQNYKTKSPQFLKFTRTTISKLQGQKCPQIIRTAISSKLQGQKCSQIYKDKDNNVLEIMRTAISSKLQVQKYP
ncbi:hypothetical protein RhiirA1_475382 [Rhizophagus irregularis]|uniref:Uncharacterized protein n=1 Tax=Rhizophagus irregularis TaxID=588596 RepID=A0A2N0QX46_9GLOM|nr:hypothetical protein RhiirA1_475382 [Rhizophagus irregularis]